MDNERQLILASSSINRRALLDRLMLPYKAVSPDIDETPRRGESPTDLVSRLSKEKALSQVSVFKDALIIGSDQVAVLEGQITGKPHTYENAFRFLQQARGKCIHFLTGLCVTDSESNQTLEGIETYKVYYKQYTDLQIEHYLEKEQPFACAGSLKSEGLGIALLDKIEGNDPSALIGLPLIKLTTILQQFNFPVL